MEFKSGSGASTQIGFKNGNGQVCQGTLGIEGTDHMQVDYKVECALCGFVYGANGSDIHERKCPNCRGGKPGIRFWIAS